MQWGLSGASLIGQRKYQWNTTRHNDFRVDTINRSNRLGRDYLYASAGIHRTLAQQYEPVAIPKCKVQIMDDENDGNAIAQCDFADQRKRFILVAQIQIACWLVEQQDAWFLRQSAGQHHLLKFTAAQFVYVSKRKILQPHIAKQRRDDAQILLRRVDAHMWLSPQQDSVKHSKSSTVRCAT